jgi:hypothetical protein
MSEPDETSPGADSLFSGVQREAAQFAGDVRWAVAKRWELALLELKIAALQVRRLTIWLAMAIVMALAVVPVAVVLASEWLGEITVWSRASWLGIFLIALLVLIPGAVAFAWWRFRRNFTGLEATLEELREDLKWLDEYLPQSKRDA